MLRCKEVTRLSASDALRTAPLRTRVAARLHLVICRHCRRYASELARIGAAVRALGDTPVRDPGRDEALVQRVLEESGRPPS
jgi:hypothetical protein